jgi:hypothetical protein
VQYIVMWWNVNQNVTKGLRSSHCDMYSWPSHCVIELCTSHCHKGLCSTHYDVWNFFSHCDIRICVSYCDVMICSLKCDDRAMPITLRHLFITVKNWVVYITLWQGLCSIYCDVWKFFSHCDMRICAMWRYVRKNATTRLCSSNCDVYLWTTHYDIILFFRLQHNYVCHIAALQWMISHVTLQCRVLNVALHWWVFVHQIVMFPYVGQIVTSWNVCDIVT